MSRRKKRTEGENVYPELLQAANASLEASVDVIALPRPRGRPKKKTSVVAAAAPPPIVVVEEDKDDVRPPDRVTRQCLLGTDITNRNPSETMDVDEMLERAIEMSRAEFIAACEREAAEKADQAERAELRRSLAIPLSRLRMWRDTPSIDATEFLFLNHILDVLRYRTRSEEEEHLLEPPPLATTHTAAFQTFVVSLQKSRLYQPLVSIFI
jgi:hypothetical protein